MQGLKIDFTSDTGPFIDFNKSVSGKDASVQNALVNIGTDKGSDRVHPTRGTDLLSKGLRGELVGRQSARHASNFAALDTRIFCASQAPDDLPDAEKIQNVFMTVTNFGSRSLDLSVSFQMADGSTLGVTPTLTI